MNRTLKPNEALDKLNGQRARINSKINLLKEAWKPDQERMQRLQRTAEDLDKRISEHGLGDA
jgi:gas vesicle protein